MPGFNNSPALITAWKTEPAFPATFAAATRTAVDARRPTEPARELCGFAVVLVATEMGTSSKARSSARRPCGSKPAPSERRVSADRGLKGGGHFAMAQLDNAAYAKVSSSSPGDRLGGEELGSLTGYRYQHVSGAVRVAPARAVISLEGAKKKVPQIESFAWLACGVRHERELADRRSRLVNEVASLAPENTRLPRKSAISGHSMLLRRCTA